MAVGQAPPPPPPPPPDGAENIPFDELEKKLSDPTVWNRFMRQFTNSGWHSAHSSNAIFSFINELHLRPKVFHANGGDSAVLGFEYDFNKSIANRTITPDSVNPMGVSLNLYAKGSVATSSSKNPDNFLESGLKLHLFQARGGMTPQIVTNAETLDLRDAIKQKMVTMDPNSAAFATLVQDTLQYARPQLAWDFAGQGSLESDQSFDVKQWTYGGALSLAYQDFRPESALNWFNLLDIPFAALRYLTIPDEGFQPSGQAFPVLIGGIDLVDPTENGVRLAADPDDSVYPRARAEVAFKTEVAELFGTRVWLSASYRYYRELGASPAIRAAGLDDFSYFLVRLDLPKGFSVSYSAGKLPLDRKNDSVYAIGWSANL